ncbi:hotdog fold thioesterase [Exilibacterium tricleocarpae]|uniref:Hotdog fold thioesterase n=1 Tax=Exilibacterium tricleocarpae TaxID=2591008 RepID=A0A545TFP4_9GAMM|nr:hotdog fold thioesterase [Exilibacterium tricleocarpae]TQV76001.1 hotdog fold thioesterase [Exilibacterium tricleocarpae]
MSQSIWFKDATPQQLNEFAKGTISDVLGIEITEVGPDFVRGTMPADARTFQPMGRVHGGANVVLAESLGSVAANMLVDTTEYFCVGLEVNANHVRGVTGGTVTGTARLLYQGRSTQVWEIRLEDERGKLSCISRLTMAVVKHGQS